MINIRGGFIRDKDGCWINLKEVYSLYIAKGESKSDFYICLRHKEGQTNIIDNSNEKNYEKCQERLDGLMDLLEYEKTGD